MNSRFGAEYGRHNNRHLLAYLFTSFWLFPCLLRAFLFPVGTLAPSLVDAGPNSSSIDVIFATYWFYPAKTKAILPADQLCIDDMMNIQHQRFDVHS